jgi:hypothetical protein
MKIAAVDAMIVDYLAQAMDGGCRSPVEDSGSLGTERLAAFRLFLWSDMAVLPTALKQLAEIKDLAWCRRLERLLLFQLPEAQIPDSAQWAIDVRASVLAQHHSCPADCRIVAEAESIGAAALLTFDHKLRKHLIPHATLPLVTPSEYWATLAIPRGEASRWVPEGSNPLSRETWWHW